MSQYETLTTGEGCTQVKPKGSKGSLANILSTCTQQDSIADVIDRVRQVTRWSTFMHENDHMEVIAQLRRALQVLRDFQAEARGGRVFEIIDALGSLQQTLCASGGMSAIVMELFAHDVEVHLAPCPDADMMKELSEHLKLIGSGTFGSEPQPITRWAEWKYLPGRAAGKEYEGMFKEQEGEFDKFMNDKLVEVRHKHDDKSIIFQHFNNILAIAGLAGRHGYWQYSHAWMDSLYDPSRTLLPWTTIGFLLKNWHRKEIMVAKDVVGGTVPHEVEIQHRFDKLLLVRIPKFVEQASELLDVLECQVNEVDRFKGKLMAYGVTAGITAGQFLVAIFNKWLHDNEFMGMK